jgi:hypothetical protein
MPVLKVPPLKLVDRLRLNVSPVRNIKSTSQKRRRFTGDEQMKTAEKAKTKNRSSIV